MLVVKQYTANPINARRTIKPKIIGIGTQKGRHIIYVRPEAEVPAQIKATTNSMIMIIPIINNAIIAKTILID